MLTHMERGDIEQIMVKDTTIKSYYNEIILMKSYYRTRNKYQCDKLCLKFSISVQGNVLAISFIFNDNLK